MTGSCAGHHAILRSVVYQSAYRPDVFPRGMCMVNACQVQHLTVLLGKVTHFEH